MRPTHGRREAARLAISLLVGLVLLASLGQGSAAAPLAATPLPPVTGGDGYGGVCYAHYYGENNRPFLPLMRNAGARHDRIDFRWDNIVAWGNYGPWDSIVNDELAQGIDLIAILWATPAQYRRPGCNPAAGLAPGARLPAEGRPPGWYAPEVGRAQALTPMGSDPGACPPVGLYNPWTVGNFNGNRWAEFAYTTVMHFKDRVRVWEIWNEIEWSWFWLGTPAEYAQLLKVGYQAVKAADPQATVLFAGLHYWADPTYYERVLDILNDDPQAAANNYYFDVMSVHLYARVSTIYDIPRGIRTRMRQYVSDHPIWLTETGVPVYDGPYPGVRSEYSARESEAAAYLIQSWANARAAGVARYHWFRVHDGDMGEHFGLTHDQNYLRPAYVAYQVAATYLISPTMATSMNYAGGVRRVTLWGTPHGKVSVLWNTVPTATVFAYPATLPSAILVNRLGVTQTLTASGGVYSLALPGATATTASSPTDYIIGGEPLLVIEKDTTPPTTALRLPLQSTHGLTITVAWEAGDDAAGVWGTDVQVRQGLTGTWTTWLSFGQTPGSGSRLYTNTQAGQTYCFRARAWDQAGNRVEWDAAPQRCTTVALGARCTCAWPACAAAATARAERRPPTGSTCRWRWPPAPGAKSHGRRGARRSR